MNQTIEHFQTAESRAQASLDSAEARKRSDKIQQLRAAIEAVEGERMKSPRDQACLNMSPFYAKEVKRAKKRQKEME